MNHQYDAALAWLFGVLAVVFAMGLSTRLARFFYPKSPSFQRRLAAPLIFGFLGIACYNGLSRPALALLVAAGLLQIIGSRWMRAGAASRHS